MILHNVPYGQRLRGTGIMGVRSLYYCWFPMGGWTYTLVLANGRHMRVPVGER